MAARSACLKISPACGASRSCPAWGRKRVRVRPLLDLGLLRFDGIGGLGFDRVAVGHVDGRGEDVSEAERAELGQHDQQPARRARRDCRERSELGGYCMPFCRKNSGVAPVGATPSALMPMTFFVFGLKMRACVSPPQPSESHIVATAPSMAHAASTALPPF